LASFEEGEVPYSKKTQAPPKGDDDFQIIRKINNNAYELDLPHSYSMIHTFNVSDLSPFYIGFKYSWLNSHQERRNDE